MDESLPWDRDQPLSISQLLKQSMRSVDTLASSNTLLDKLSIHLNGLLSNQEPQVDQAVQLFDNMFQNASKALETDNDKHVLAVLHRQLSSFIGVTLGVKPFLGQREEKELQDEDENENKLSWSSADAWHQSNFDIDAPERREHKKLHQQLEEEAYGQAGSHGEDKEEDEEEDGSGSEYEEVIERVAVKSREIGGAGGFEVVRRKQKKKKNTTTIATNFSYNRTSNSYDNNQASYNNNNNYYNPHHQVRVCEFRPKTLDDMPSDTFCIPLFFPSEDSYSMFHAALSSAKQTLYVCVFSLTDNDTANVLIDARNRGVDVKVITDNDQMDTRKGSDIIRLSEQYGIPYKKDNSDQFMHNKFAVMDGKTVITGSFNWSAGARYKNRENIVITNIPSVVSEYSQEFEQLWKFF